MKMRLIDKVIGMMAMMSGGCGGLVIDPRGTDGQNIDDVDDPVAPHAIAMTMAQ